MEKVGGGLGLVWICFVVAHFERMSFEHVPGFGRQLVLSESCCFLKMSNLGSDGDYPFWHDTSARWWPTDSEHFPLQPSFCHLSLVKRFHHPAKAFDLHETWAMWVFRRLIRSWLTIIAANQGGPEDGPFTIKMWVDVGCKFPSDFQHKPLQPGWIWNC